MLADPGVPISGTLIWIFDATCEVLTSSAWEPKLIGELAHPVPETLMVTLPVAGLVVIVPKLPAVMQSKLYVPGAVSMTAPCEPTDKLRKEPGTIVPELTSVDDALAGMLT